MTVGVPSLEGSLYLTDPQSIIAYTLRRYFKSPKHTVPLLGDMIISLPWQVAQHGREPETLVANMQTDLQNVFNRIFGDERKVTATVMHTPNGDSAYDVTISVIYTQLNGEIGQTGTTISLGTDGFLKIPEDTLKLNLKPTAR